MTDTVNHKANPILLTPDDLGTEFMTREGRCVECIICHDYFDDIIYIFSDGGLRRQDGRSGESHYYDIVSRISEQVA